jgi:hypothetical protein
MALLLVAAFSGFHMSPARARECKRSKTGEPPTAWLVVMGAKLTLQGRSCWVYTTIAADDWKPLAPKLAVELECDQVEREDEVGAVVMRIASITTDLRNRPNIAKLILLWR